MTGHHPVQNSAGSYLASVSWQPGHPLHVSLCTAGRGEGTHARTGLHSCATNKTLMYHYLIGLLLSKVSGTRAALGHSIHTQTHTTHAPTLSKPAAALPSEQVQMAWLCWVP
jgi:hypothetical protein